MVSLSVSDFMEGTDEGGVRTYPILLGQKVGVLVRARGKEDEYETHGYK